ncbi:hypothetical protein PC9H_010587 [Pleurotus ostreatus]|uniref:tripeptidyl-peptidase II n=2 Tax=Pleurotus ostreatus TaxID=5322 RepID=A0A067NPQ5_PLEO1|nr:uncharacterized protein PC9H_010587 [Pleurotus ostreatus]KAF7422431.1 hypothetical protein PC9H_010587 [Pleurotus ostreatus]KDQ25616.1 hypothetical protein PLEOSDRAFT_1094062 [Pleurotus ostreatus PC15]
MLWSLIFLGLVQSSLAAPPIKRWDAMAEKHSWTEVPQGWEYHSPAPQGMSFQLRIGLKQDRVDDLIRDLYEVSDPAHHRYGNHLSKEDVDALVAPHPESVETLNSWLQHHGIDPEQAVYRSGGGDWITHRVTVAQAEKMLGTKYNVYHRPETGSYIVRTLKYSLPRDLHDHVDVVSPTTYFGKTEAMRVNSFMQPEVPTMQYDLNQFNADADAGEIPASCARQVTPYCLRLLYKTIDYVPGATDRNKLGVTGYLKEYTSNNDLQEFFKRFRPEALGTKLNITLVHDGLNDDERPGTEANLDVQYAMAIAHPTPTVFYSTGGSPPFIADDATMTNTNEPYLDWLEHILNETSIPQTLTTSYGDDEQTVPVEYQKRVCSMFAQLGARGSSVIFSSGDYGVGPGLCYTNDGLKTQKFIPHFPASCPFVTTVSKSTGGIPEKTAGLSGGGFSFTFPRPSYQDAQVKAYLSLIGDAYSGLYNESGRGFPDVAGQARGYQIVHKGTVRSIGGTSAAAPVVAGIVSLLNDYQLTKGQPPLGFLNPWLYSEAASAFNDIVKGSNPGCRTLGFSAHHGWDPVTGLGTPDFEKLKALLDKRITAQ